MPRNRRQQQDEAVLSDPSTAHALGDQFSSEPLLPTPELITIPTPATLPSGFTVRKAITDHSSTEQTQIDDTDHLEVEGSELKGFWERLWGTMLACIVVHYIYWSLPLYALLGYLVYIGYWYVSVLLVLCYLPSFLSGAQLKRGRPWDALRRCRWFWGPVLRYNSLRVVRTHRLDPECRYVFALAPHNILVLSRVACYAGLFETLFPGIRFRVLGATPMFYAPGCRELCLWLSAVDARRSVAERLLSEGFSLQIYPEGTRGIFLTDPDSSTTRLYLSRRKGFIRLALRQRAQVVPCVVLGEKYVYRRAHFSESVKRFFYEKFSMPMLLFWGRFGTLLPLPGHMTVVYGKPIEVDLDSLAPGEEPSDELVHRVHVEYMRETARLYRTYQKQHPSTYDETLVIE